MYNDFVNLLTTTPNNTTIFDGKKLAQEILENEVKPLAQKGNFRLDIIWIGNNPESKIYVSHKKEKAEEVGIQCEIHNLEESVTQGEVEELILSLNKNPEVTGYIIQLPVPKHINSKKLFQLIDPRKDVDGLSPWNLGKLWQYQEALAPATAEGVMRILEESGTDLKGLDVVVINTSDIVGKPLGAMLLRKGATVTFCNSKTRDLFHHTIGAEVIISAVGQPEMIKGDMIKNDVILIDVATKKKEVEVDGIIKNQLFGDFEFETCKEKASFITPVPGGVGPMTVAMLLKNICKAGGAL